MEAIALILHVILFLQCRIISANYEYICEPGLMKKPYLKVYNTRLGDILMDEGPGFYDVAQRKNIYVCINGPVVLYFTRHTKFGDVFDEAKNTLATHKCQYYNGESTGPGPHQKGDHLKGILLMGNEEDFTLPYAKVFTAPYLVNEKDGTYENVTSVITLGARKCELFKGPNKQSVTIDFINMLAEFQMCRLAYQTIERWSQSNDNETKIAFKNEGQSVTEGQCSKTPEPTVTFIDEYFASKKDTWDKLVPQFVKGLAPTDESANIGAYQTNITTLQDLLAKSDNATASASYKEELLTSKAELEKLETKQLYYDVYTKLGVLESKTLFGDIDVKLTNLKTDIMELQRLKKEKEELEQQYKDTDPEDTAAVKAIVDKYKEVGEKIDKSDVDEKFSLILPDVADAEEDLKQFDVLLQLLPKIKKEVDTVDALAAGVKYDATMSKQLIQASKQLAETIIVEIYGNATESGGTPRVVADTVPEANDICIDLPLVGQKKYRVEDPIMRGTCYYGKGTKLFGCQLLKARLGEPGICGLDEAASDDQDIPHEPVQPASYYLPDHMIDILNLINEIYKKACNRIRPVFAPRINNILQCYLIKDRANRNQTKVDGPTPERVRFWAKIITALESCRDEGHALKFARHSPSVAKYYLMKGEDFLEIPLLKEQADNEYAFNFAIDMSWKIFATVLGICSPSYQPKIPLINTRFFTLYTEEFLQPIQDTWISDKDNNVFKRIMSYYYGVGGSEAWANLCMEASFLYSQDGSYRPPRKLPVNGGSESNYFVDTTK